MWKHKTKWLVRGGRKVRCYLCGKKILAKGDPFLFHGDTGYYSHQSCQAESTTISGNERRKAVKKIAVGAAVVGAIAAGAGKLIDISSQSKGSNSPAAQTILTSQGLIPPALTSDPANPVPGQMWYRSDAGVMAHFDAVQNRVVYSSEINDGNVNVTSKGIVNGLSVLPNDGKGGFGPDTTKGATAPGQYGSPYTETSGIQDAWSYALLIAYYTGNYVNASSYDLPEIHLLEGQFTISTKVIFSGGTKQINSFKLSGAGGVATDIVCVVSNDYAIEIDPNTTQNTGVVFSNFSYDFIGSCIGFVNWNFTSNPSGDPWLIWHDFNAGSSSAGSYTSFISGLYAAYISGNVGSTNVMYVSAAVVYFTGASAEAEINTGNSQYVHIVSANKIYLGNNTSIADIEPLGPCLVEIGSTSASMNANVSIKNANNLSVVMNAPSLSLSIENVNIGATGATLLTSNGYSLAMLYMKNIFTDNNPVYLTDGKLSVSTVKLENIVVFNYFKNIPVNTPTLAANPPASGTVYQNTNNFDIEIDLSVYATTPGTAGYVTVAKGLTDTPAAIGNQYVSGGTSSTATQIIRVRVPANWYYEFTGSGVAFGTASVFAD